jgi:hypothetical protein
MKAQKLQSSQMPPNTNGAEVDIDMPSRFSGAQNRILEEMPSKEQHPLDSKYMRCVQTVEQVQMFENRKCDIFKCPQLSTL